MTSSPGAPHLSCNIAKELKRWREGAKSRVLSSGSSRNAHIRPWEGKIPIHAPPQVFPRHFSRSLNDQTGGKALVPLPRRQNAEKARKGENRRRPATAGVIRTRSMAPTAGELTGSKEALRMTPQRGGGREAALARGALLSRASENASLLRRPHDRHHDKRVATWRVFDSTAAEWVHTAVLTHRTRRTPAAASGARCVVSDISSAAAAAGQGEKVGGASLTTAAQSAVEEVFDRYDCSSEADRGFLLSAEISALQEIWTRPDAEPPPPRLLPKPKSTPRKSPQALTATKACHARSTGGSGGGGSVPREVSEARGNGGPFDRRVLTRPAFVEFCRRAAARDAIFIRHFFTRSGYDCLLELMVPPTVTSAEPVASSAHRRKGPVVSERRRSKDSNHSTAGGNYAVEPAGIGSRQGSRGQARLRRGGSVGDGGGQGGGKEIAPPTSPPAAGSQDRGLLAQENDELRCLASGGLVDPAELWLWTEDERDHGERQNLDGLLSRGGGAHVSRTATAAIVGSFASANGPCGATTTAPDKENAGGTSTAEARGTEGGKEGSAGYLPEFNMTGDDGESTTVSAAQKSEVGASTPLCRAAPPPGGTLATGTGGSTVASSRGPSAQQCEWCGAVVVAGGKASHSAAFCDEEVVRVPNVRR